MWTLCGFALGLCLQMIPPPPPMSPDMGDDEAMGSMLISWYMSGYHTGYYLVWIVSLTNAYLVHSKIIFWWDFNLNKLYFCRV